MNPLKKLMVSCKGAIAIVEVVVDVVLVTALIPIIVTFIAGAENLSTTESTLLSLTTLFIILALVFNIVRQSGLTKKK